MDEARGGGPQGEGRNGDRRCGRRRGTFMEDAAFVDAAAKLPPRTPLRHSHQGRRLCGHDCVGLPWGMSLRTTPGGGRAQIVCGPCLPGRSRCFGVDLAAAVVALLTTALTRCGVGESHSLVYPATDARAVCGSWSRSRPQR